MDDHNDTYFYIARRNIPGESIMTMTAGGVPSEAVKIALSEFMKEIRWRRSCCLKGCATTPTKKRAAISPRMEREEFSS